MRLHFHFPCPQVEEALQEIWQDALNLPEPPSVTADFFSLGGSSLKAGERVPGRALVMLSVLRCTAGKFCPENLV